jgi:uncharacterized protein (TIGR04255 family)
MSVKLKKSHIQNELPYYKNPPVNEVVCGLRFKTPDNLKIPHIGILWSKFLNDYPVIQHAPPIASSKGEIIIDKQVNVPLPRVWFVNMKDDQLIQFQFDRFYFNWRKRERKYPRYQYVIKNYLKILDVLRDFFINNDLGELKPLEYELTYLNHIPQGEGWETIEDLPNLFRDFIWNMSAERFLQNPQKITWGIEFQLPEQNGTLFVNLKHGIKKSDKRPILILELSVKLIDDSILIEKILEWYNLSHEYIVRGFSDLTTPEIQKIWGRE